MLQNLKIRLSTENENDCKHLNPLTSLDINDEIRHLKIKAFYQKFCL